MRYLIVFLCWVLLSSCANTSPQRPIDPMRKVDNFKRVNDYRQTPFIGHPVPHDYSICHNNGCAEFSFISLSFQQWPNIESLFIPLAQNAQQEREQIKLAITQLEIHGGEQSPTYKDKAENYLRAGIEGQLDCIDEATNTTVYLRMLANADLLKFHQQSSRISRGGVIIPHTTATIIEIKSKQRYAVDSWFGANGEPPHIVPLNLWKTGWKPEKN